MTTQTQERERRDWAMLIFIIPIGILLIIIVGQFAIQLLPFWSVNADMNSNLEPDPASARPFALLEPILPQILTPMAWMETYLTPGTNFSYPPFLTFEPTATPSPTTATPTGTPPTPTATGTPSPSATATTGTPVSTKPPGGGGGGTPPPNDILGCTDPTASNYDPLATIDDGSCIPKVFGCMDPDAINYDPSANVDDGSCIPKVFGCMDPDALNYNPSANVDDGSCVLPIVSTPPAGTPMPVPNAIGTAQPDNSIGSIDDGRYIVIALAVTVGLPDGNYDLALYEHNYNGAGYVNLDLIIVGISNDENGASYYEVFNWGNNVPDTNSNLNYMEMTPDGNGCNTECDNRQIPLNDLYDPDYNPGPPETNGPAPSTGILIDVDTAPSNPKPGIYQYVVIISPTGGSGQAAEVDAIQAIEVPIPTPTP